MLYPRRILLQPRTGGAHPRTPGLVFLASGTLYWRLSGLGRWDRFRSQEVHTWSSRQHRAQAFRYNLHMYMRGLAALDRAAMPLDCVPCTAHKSREHGGAAAQAHQADAPEMSRFAGPCYATQRGVQRQSSMCLLAHPSQRVSMGLPPTSPFRTSDLTIM